MWSALLPLTSQINKEIPAGPGLCPYYSDLPNVTNGTFCTSVVDPGPHVFGPSGSIRQRYKSGFRILPFSHKGVEQTEIMLAK